jgi:hypothetical protein
MNFHENLELLCLKSYFNRLSYLIVLDIYVFLETVDNK